MFRRSSFSINGDGLNSTYFLSMSWHEFKELLSSMPIKSLSPYSFSELAQRKVVVPFWIEWFSSCGAFYSIECHLCFDVWMDCDLMPVLWWIISRMGMKAIRHTQWLKAYFIFSVSVARQRKYSCYEISIPIHKRIHNLR